MATVLPKVDVVLVGVGWTNGILAKELTARTGLKVVGLERGPYLRQDRDYAFDHDELRFEHRKALMQDLTKEPVTWRPDLKSVAVPMRVYGSFNPGNQVGGAGVHWAAQTWRAHPDDLTWRTTLKQVLGKDPEQASLAPGLIVSDWPISYDELEPYFTKAEIEIGVSGRAGVLKDPSAPGGVRYQEGGNRWEGPRSQDYPLPPLIPTNDALMFRDVAAGLGLHPFPQPSEILSQPYRGAGPTFRPACTYCGFCTRYGCHVGAKGSALVTMIPLAEATGRFEVRPNSYVIRINTKDGMATGVTYIDTETDTEYEQPADIVVLGAYMLNNVRLLLLSKIGQPYNPNTGEGVVGRAYTYQGRTPSVSAWFPNFLQVSADFGNSGQGYLSDAYGTYLSEFRLNAMDKIGPIGVFALSVGGGGSGPISIVSGMSVPGGRNWGAEWKQFVLDNYPGRSISIGGSAASPAYAYHYVDLDPTYTDSYGLPVLRITFDWTENENKMYAGAYEIKRAIMEEMMATYGGERMSGNPRQGRYSITPYQSTHNTGGAIMGDNPKTSVVNRYLQVWGVPNLFVQGASAFPQNFWMNPTGTIQALAYWLADALIDRYLKSPGPLVTA